MKQMDFREELAKLTPRLRDNRPGKVYVFGVGEWWKVIHQIYINVVNVDLAEYIFAFVDNDPAKQGTEYMGRQVITPAEMDTENAVVLISGGKATSQIMHQLQEFGLTYGSNYYIPYYFELILKRFVYQQTSQFNKMRNGRCFVIGNAPSLRVEDLDTLHEANETTFAVNRITEIFDKTAWCPTYYLLVDPNASPGNDAINLMKIPKFLRMNMASSDIFDEYVYYFDEDRSGFYYDYPYKFKFSTEIERMFFGGTVIHFAIQAAASMGYNEIYLYGVDNLFKTQVSNDGTIIANNVKPHFYDEIDYMVSASQMDLIREGYVCAREYCDSHNIKIRNATRGGALEVFERVNFNSLFKNVRQHVYKTNHK